MGSGKTGCHSILSYNFTVADWGRWSSPLSNWQTLLGECSKVQCRWVPSVFLHQRHDGLVPPQLGSHCNGSLDLESFYNQEFEKGFWGDTERAQQHKEKKHENHIILDELRALKLWTIETWTYCLPQAVLSHQVTETRLVIENKSKKPPSCSRFNYEAKTTSYFPWKN